ncbi:hypothetical protein L3X38_009578 [Prunus dulcis]|uniref:Uncharacterized protein n=2 Tax=Prunus dulcis TaxID=3755 RepID=A0AAD4WDX6_PRUDU|nr:hypothetical protein L3X38_009578 [Prunus dulcis]
MLSRTHMPNLPYVSKNALISSLDLLAKALVLVGARRRGLRENVVVGGGLAGNYSKSVCPLPIVLIIRKFCGASAVSVQPVIQRIWASHLCQRRDATAIGHRRFRNHHPRKNLNEEAWKQLGFGVDTSGISPHALHLFAEMSHSCWVCNGGTALLDFDLGYHMGIRDNGGGDSFGRGIEGLEAVRGEQLRDKAVKHLRYEVILAKFTWTQIMWNMVTEVSRNMNFGIIWIPTLLFWVVDNMRNAIRAFLEKSYPFAENMPQPPYFFK